MLLQNNAFNILHVHRHQVASRILSKYHFLLRKTHCTYHSSTNHTHVNLLTIASNSKSLRQTKQVHAFALHNGFLPRSVSLCASLILRYAAFQESNACFLLFEQTISYCHTAFLWNTFIRALLVAHVHDGFVTYNRMVRTRVPLDNHTFPFVLKACADNLELQKGMEIHGHLFKLGFEMDVFVGNTLLLFYGNCGLLENVRSVFDEMRERDIVSWNTIIGLLSVNGCYVEALDLYCDMILRSGFKPNSVTTVSILPVCGSLANEVMARQIHCFVVKVGLGVQMTISNALVDVYGKCGNMMASRQVFDEMVERNEVSWNAVIASLAHTGCNKDALDMFRLMICAGLTPNSIAISIILPVLVEEELFGLGKEIHRFCLRIGIESDVFVANSMIDMYAKSGHQSEASSLFHNMLVKNVVTWNAMIANFTQNRQELAALELLRAMSVHNKIPNSVTLTNVLPACARVGFLLPGKEIHAVTIRMGFNLDLFVTNALTDMYAKCGRLDLAQSVFDISRRDEISYNILIVSYAQTSDCSKSLSLFSEMGLKGMMHDAVSFVGAISACGKLAATKQGKEIHAVVTRKLFHTHLFVANSLLDFYSRCGRIDIADKIFVRIPNKDAASWNTMILGYGMLGDLDMAIDLFENMRERGVQYDSVSYIAVLSACSHGGFVEKGRKYFEEMQAQNIEPTQMHYACMVDLLGRAGLMEDVVELIKNLPIIPESNIWGALLGACRIHGNIELGSWAAEHLLKLKPEHCGYYILLSNMYAEAGKWDEANKIRELMKSRGAKKNPAYSWVQTGDQVQAFVVGEVMENSNPGLWHAECG
ncbi:pentatricopeptide repeat-containing protein At4g14170-like [Mangifera indica]|uniref:pentatricopeptide repeat-containing protein At4g14170-like n=1 Tax=Mangifera indica TaxID=29780 RepID=UPI001CFC1E58|nr:pentatricopeptide repeat-containing protein At4g14170-like [Mangifera indica]